MNNPFRRKKPNPKRREPRRVGNGREILTGAAKTARRREIFNRSEGRCEGRVTRIGIWTARSSERDGLQRCNAPIEWETFHWSHNKHGARKSDALDAGAALCENCHLVGVHNPKSCKRRPGKVMKIKDAQAYWSGKICFCDGPKKEYESFCATCSPKLAEQTRHTLEHTDDPQVYRETLAQAEIEILQWRPKE